MQDKYLTVLQAQNLALANPFPCNPGAVGGVIDEHGGALLAQRQGEVVSRSAVACSFGLQKICIQDNPIFAICPSHLDTVWRQHVSRGVHNLGELTHLVGCVGECKGWKVLSRRNQPSPGRTWIIDGGITRGRNRRHRLSGRSPSSFGHCWICRDRVSLEFTQFSAIATRFNL